MFYISADAHLLGELLLSCNKLNAGILVISPIQDDDVYQQASYFHKRCSPLCFRYN